MKYDEVNNDILGGYSQADFYNMLVSMRRDIETHNAAVSAMGWANSSNGIEAKVAYDLQKTYHNWSLDKTMKQYQRLLKEYILRYGNSIPDKDAEQ